MNQSTDKLHFKGGNPGAVQFGNFINYYQFHYPDERIKLLPKNIWDNKNNPFTVLDIGCNAGNLTVALKDYLKENISTDISVLGIDIDPVLIQRAKELNSDINFQSLDIMDEENRNTIINKYLKSQKANKFSVVFCFSTTMWIHLNYGDSGLKTFLEYICSISEMVVVEPQPWKCYKTAVKRMKQTDFVFQEFTDIKFRETIEKDIENILTQHCDMIKVSESERTNWDRKLLIFRNIRT